MLLTAMRMYCVTVVYRTTEQTGLDNQSARFSIRAAFMRTLWIYYACSFKCFTTASTSSNFCSVEQGNFKMFFSACSA